MKRSACSLKRSLCLVVLLVACGGEGGTDVSLPDADPSLPSVTTKKPLPVVSFPGAPDALAPDAEPVAPLGGSGGAPVGTGGAPSASGGVIGTGGAPVATGGSLGTGGSAGGTGGDAGGSGGSPYPEALMKAFQDWPVAPGCGQALTVKEVERTVLGPQCATNCHNPSNPGIGSYVYSEHSSWTLPLVNARPRRFCTVDEPTARIIDPYNPRQSLFMKVNVGEAQCPYGRPMPPHQAVGPQTYVCLNSYLLAVSEAFRQLGLE